MINHFNLLASLKKASYQQSKTFHHFLCGRMIFSTLSKSLATFKHAERHITQLSVCILTDLCRVSSAGHVLGSDGLFDAVHLLLIAFAVTCCVLFGLFERRLQSLHALRRRPQALLQLGQLTAQVSIITYQLHREKKETVSVCVL